MCECRETFTLYNLATIDMKKKKIKMLVFTTMSQFGVTSFYAMGTQLELFSLTQSDTKELELLAYTHKYMKPILF